MPQNKDRKLRDTKPTAITNLQWNILSKLCIALLCIYFVRTEEEHTTEKDKLILDERDKWEAGDSNMTASEMFLDQFKDEEITHKKLREILFDNMIIPDCLDVTPNHTVQVQFFHGYVVNLGNLISAKNITKMSPHFVKWPGTLNEYFTLIMVDLDEPQRLYPDEREWLHWMIVNIPGYTRYLGDLKARYIPPKPIEESGKHRYVFVVYKQPKKMKFEDLELINGTKHSDLKRGHFSTRLFAKKYELGDPWAVNFFEAQHEF